MNITELVDAAAKAAVEGEANDEIGFSFHTATAKAEAAGDIELAARMLTVSRRLGFHPRASAATEARSQRQRAENGARVFRAINKANLTRDPLPKWIAAEIGETH